MTSPDVAPAGGWQARVHELVDPFYVDLMGLNARSIEPAAVQALVAIGGTVTVAETISLLRIGWRETVMGAWFSLFVHDTDAVLPELLKALSVASGSSTAPSLAVASTMLAGRDALPELGRYVERDLDGEPWGSAGFVSAAIDHLGGESTHLATPDDHANFQSLMQLGQSFTWK